MRMAAWKRVPVRSTVIPGIERVAHTSFFQVGMFQMCRNVVAVFMLLVLSMGTAASASVRDHFESTAQIVKLESAYDEAIARRR